MTSAFSMHLTTEDLDALLFGTEDARVHVHLETCRECRSLVVADRNVVLALESLPQFAPRPGFSDRVMAQVALPTASTRRFRLRVPTLARAAAFSLLFLGSLAASISWSLANHTALMAWRDRGLQWVMGWFEGGLGGLFSELNRLPWADTAREAIGSPGRLALVALGFLLVYAAGLMALRRLTALPLSGPATHAT